MTMPIANAPVSYGVFELTADDAPSLPDPEQLLDAVAEAGYVGVDLGPLGYLGDPSQVVDRLSARGLALAGGWVQLPLVDDDAYAGSIHELEDALEVFAAARDAWPDLPPRPTLADAGSPERHANPGGGRHRPELRLDADGWRTLARTVDDATRRCRDRGLEPTFHHHACTFVESPEEIERFLEVTDVDLCLDTGHLLLGGGDPVTDLRRWHDRINHIHLKDVHLDVVEAIVTERAGMRAVWERGTFCELGHGDLDLDGFLDELDRQAFDGWVVVEQDRIAAPGEPLDVAADAQARNHAYLAGRDPSRPTPAEEDRT
jgi:inosose dehydratase